MATTFVIIDSVNLSADVTSNQMNLEDVVTAGVRVTVTDSASISATLYLQSTNTPASASSWANRTLTLGDGTTAASVSISDDVTHTFAIAPDESHWRLFADFGTGAATIYADYADTVRSRQS